MKKYIVLVLIFLSCFNIQAQKGEERLFNFYDNFNTVPSTEKGYRNFEITVKNQFLLDTISEQGRQKDGFIITEMNSTGVNGLHNKIYGANMHNESPVF